MEKPKLLQEHIKIGTIYYYFNYISKTASEPRKICKIAGERFYYGTNESEYNVINDMSLYLIRLPIARYMGYIECSETTSLLHNELRAYLMMKQGGLNGSGFHFKANYSNYFINENNQISRDITNLNRYSYYNDTNNFLEWASRNSVKSNETTYKVGDYIVCLDNANPSPGQNKANPGGQGFLKNTCFKIIRIKNIDEYQVLFCENHINGIYNNSVRPATTNEIAKYNLLGSHYDVVNDSLVGRYVKALKDSIDSSRTKKDLIYKIIKEDDKEIVLNIKIAKYIAKNSLKHLEIMPIKFTPNKDQPEEEFKQGDWIIRKSSEYNLSNMTTGKMYKAGEIILNENIVYVIDDDEILCRFHLDKFRKATKEEIHRFKKYVLRDMEIENSYNNYGAAMKQSEKTNISLTNSNSEKVIKLIKPQPKKMSIVPVLPIDIKLRTNTKLTQIKI